MRDFVQTSRWLGKQRRFLLSCISEEKMSVWWLQVKLACFCLICWRLSSFTSLWELCLWSEFPSTYNMYFWCKAFTRMCGRIAKFNLFFLLQLQPWLGKWRVWAPGESRTLDSTLDVPGHGAEGTHSHSPVSAPCVWQHIAGCSKEEAAGLGFLSGASFCSMTHLCRVIFFFYLSLVWNKQLFNPGEYLLPLREVCVKQRGMMGRCVDKFKRNVSMRWFCARSHAPCLQFRSHWEKLFITFNISAVLSLMLAAS